MRIKVEILVNERTIMKFSMVNMNFKEIRENKEGTTGDTSWPKTPHASSQIGMRHHDSSNTFVKTDVLSLDTTIKENSFFY
jgi:hypothetical protein